MVSQIVISPVALTISISSGMFVIALIVLILKINKIRSDLLAKKLDGSIFDEHKKIFDAHVQENVREIERIQTNQTIIQLKQNELLTKIVESTAEMKTDISWLKNNINKR